MKEENDTMISLSDLEHLLAQARSEISTLRERNALLAARLEGMETMRQAWQEQTRRSANPGINQDVNWQIDRALESLKLQNGLARAEQPSPAGKLTKPKSAAAAAAPAAGMAAPKRPPDPPVSEETPA
jgi:hypothetical protein